VMSPKDICCVGALDEIAAAGVSILKIEGRGRSADYVDAVTRVYREALDACLDGTFSVERALEWERRLEKTFNRGFWKGGYYLGEPVEAWAAASGNRSGKRKTHIGKITNYFAKIGVAEITLDAGGLKRDDEFVVVGPTTGALTAEAGNILLDGVDVPEAYKGDVISVEIPMMVIPLSLKCFLKCSMFRLGTLLITPTLPTWSVNWRNAVSFWRFSRSFRNKFQSRII